MFLLILMSYTRLNWHKTFQQLLSITPILNIINNVPFSLTSIP